MTKPADFTTPQLNTAWTHYANIVAAAPLMNDATDNLGPTGTLTITNPNGSAVWADASTGGRGLERTGNTAGDSFSFAGLLPTGGTGTIIVIHEVETAVTDLSRYFMRGSNFYVRYTVANNQIVTVIQQANACTSAVGGNAGNFVTTTGYKVIVITWNDDERHVYQSDNVDPVTGVPDDAYAGTETNYNPGALSIENCVLLSQSDGEAAVLGVVLLGIVSLDTMLTQEQAQAIIESPWDWVEDGNAANTAPSFDGPNISNLAGTVGVAITPVSMTGRFSDADGDTLSYAEGGTWPARNGGGSWVNASTGEISGTVDAGETPGTFSSLTVDANDGTDTTSSNTFSFVVNAAGDVPTVSAVSGNVVHGQPLTITGTNLIDATVTLDYLTVSMPQTRDTQTETEIVVNAVDSSDFPYGALTLTVTEAGVGTATFSVTHVAPAGYEYVVVDVPWADTADSIFEGSPPTAAADGDQIEYEIASERGAEVLVRADGTVRVADNTGRHLFNVRIWDESALEWGASTEISVTEASYVPGTPTFDGPPIKDYALTAGDGFSLDATARFSDPDGDTLTYSLGGTWPDWVTNADGVITGTAAGDQEWSSLTVIATNSFDYSGVSNTFSITVTPVPPPYADVDRISIENRGGYKRQINNLSGIELRARFLDHTGTLAYPRDPYWQVVNCDTGQVVQDWQLLTIQGTRDDSGNYTDIWGDIEVSGLLHDVSRDRRFAVQVAADKGDEREFSTSWEYWVRYVVL